MFNNRKLTVTVDKVNKKPLEATVKDDTNFETKAEFVLRKVEKLAVKAFAGLCIYVIVDTYRQVEVAKANNTNS